MGEMEELLERVTAAQEMTWDLFMDVCNACYPPMVTNADVEAKVSLAELIGPEAWTDAALALVERTAPDLFVHLGDLDPTDMRACATLSHGYPDQPSYRGFGPRRQYAIALLAALLRALIKDQSNG